MLALASAGAGHGHYEFARLFFPYTMLLAELTDSPMNLPLITLALLQFPFYGGVIGWAAVKHWARRAIILLFLTYAVAVSFLFVGPLDNR